MRKPQNIRTKILLSKAKTTFKLDTLNYKGTIIK